jgi:hypothetical protein
MISELRLRPHPVPHMQVDLHARLAVLGVTGAAVVAMTALGCSLPDAVISALAAATGGIEICARLTEPYPAPWIRIIGLIVILVLVIIMLSAGLAPVAAAAMALTVTGTSVEVARRLAHQSPQIEPSC